MMQQHRWPLAKGHPNEGHCPLLLFQRPLEHPGKVEVGPTPRAQGLLCCVAHIWAAVMPPAGSRPPRPPPSAAPPRPRASTTCTAARPPTRCSHPAGGQPPVGDADSQVAAARFGWRPGDLASKAWALTAACPPGMTAAIRTGESPRSVKPKPPSPRVRWMGPTSCHRFLAENTDGGPWRRQVRGLAGLQSEGLARPAP